MRGASHVFGQVKRDLSCGNLGVLVAAFLYFDASFMLWVLLGALGNDIAGDLGLSTLEKGLLAAVPILSGAALRPVLGLLVDRVGGRRTALLGVALTVLPLLLGWLVVNGLSGLYVVGLFLGVPGASFAVALPLASRWYPPERQGLVLGIAGAGNSGTVIAFLLAPRIAEASGWHTVFGLALLPLAAVFAVLLLLAQDSPRQPPPISARDYRAALSQPDAGWFCLFYGVTFGGFVGLGAYFAILLHDSYALSKMEAANFAALAVFLGSFTRPIGGLVADRMGGTRVLSGVFAAVAAVGFSLALRPPLPLSIALLLSLLAVLGLGNGAVFQLMPQRFYRQMGSMTGLVGASGGLGGFCLPILLSSLATATGSPGPGFLVFGLAATIALALLVTLQPGWRRSWLWDEVSQSRATRAQGEALTVPVED
jgi:NNP family nitrate/nitrite transporter-like MFS transporter